MTGGGNRERALGVRHSMQRACDADPPRSRYGESGSDDIARRAAEYLAGYLAATGDDAARDQVS